MRLLSLILLLCSTSTIAQHKFYIGAEAGAKFERTYILDEGSHLSTNLEMVGGSANADIIYGINISYHVNDHLQIGSGLLNISLSDRWALTSDSYGTGHGGSGLRGWEIPLEARIPLNLVKKKLFMVPFISTSTIIMPKRSERGGRGDSGDIIYEYETTVIKRVGGLIGGGIKVELKTAKCTYITLSASYHKGFSRIYQLDIDYEAGNSGPLHGTIHTNGGMFYSAIGVGFPISGIPHKHE